MTIEELQAALKQTQEELAKERAAKEQLALNQSNQNSYITKLEGQINTLKQEIANLQTTANKDPRSDAGIDPTLINYLKKQMRKDIETEGYARAKSLVTEEVWKTLEKELVTFVKDSDDDKVTPEYIVDAFRLLYGRAMTNPEHPIHKVAKPTQAPAPAAITPPTLPPSMTPNDSGAAGGTPPSMSQGVQVKNTQEAMKAFKEKILNAGRNNFM